MFEMKRCSGLPSAVPRCSVEIKQRTCLLIARPACDHDARFLGTTATINELLNTAIRPEEKLPRISRRETASLSWIFHHNLFRGSLPDRQFLHTFICTVALVSQ